MAERASIVIPAHDAERFIARAIDSVLAQTHPEVECIVVDDGSTDRTGEVVAGYGGRVRYLRQENACPSAARNRGIAAATGSLVGFLDADDRYYPRKVERQAALLEAAPAADAVICDCLVTTHRGEPLHRLFQQHPLVYSVTRSPVPGGFLLGRDVFEYLLTDAFIYTGSLLIRREALERVGGYRAPLPGADIAEDVQFHLRVAYHLRLAVVDEVLYEAGVGRPGSVTSRRADLIRATLAMYDGLPEVLPGLSSRLRRLVRERRRLWALRTGIGAIYGQEEPALARWLLREAAKTRMDARTAYYLLRAYVPERILGVYRRLRGRAAGGA